MDYHAQIQQILDYFNVTDVRYSGKVWVGPCPVHGGCDCNFKIYEPGYKGYDNTGPPIWKCYSNQCHAGRQGLVGLIQGIWTYQRGGHPPRDFLQQFYKREDRKPQHLTDFYKEVRLFQEPKPLEVESLPPLEPLSPYFQSRGYSSSILQLFGVGDCREGFYRGRAVVPIRDMAGRLVGSCGRSIYPQCHFCGSWHGGRCPDPEKRRHYSKWTNLPSCPIHDLFLGLDIIQEEVYRTRTIVLCEGAGDALRLQDGGIRNSTCIFGVELSQAQINLLAKLGAVNVVLALDNDEAGQNGSFSIAEKLKFFYTVRNIPKNLYKGKKDMGDIRDVSEIRKYVRN